ncbi:MAG: hypothetical protein PHF70_14825, partial [Opitutales bacterium]|nr:hypothetical protein [Opitutales bacterium]
MDKDPFCRDAALPGVEEASRRATLRRQFKVGVGLNNERVTSTQFNDCLFDLGAGKSSRFLPGFPASG